MPYGVADKAFSVEVFTPHFDRGYTRVIVRAVVVDAVVHIDAGGVLSFLVFSAHSDRTVAHLDRTENVKHLRDRFFLIPHFR